MPTSNEPLHLNDADLAFLLNVLRAATRPMTTAQLVEALKNRSAK